MKWISKLSDSEIKSLYKLLLGENQEFVEAHITRNEDTISVEGVIRISTQGKQKKIDDDYDFSDFSVIPWYPREDSIHKDIKLRMFLYKKFGLPYAEDYLLHN